MRWLSDSGRTGEADWQTVRSPLLTGLPYVGLSVAVLGVGWAAALSMRWISVLSVSLALAGIVLTGRDALVLARRRRTADRWLRLARRCSPTSSYAWRATELCSAKERRRLAKSLRSILTMAAAPQGYPRSVVLNRGVLQHAEAVEKLAQRLECLELPVSPAGILLLHDLLTDGGSPLHDPQRTDELSDAIDQVMAAVAVE